MNLIEFFKIINKKLYAKKNADFLVRSNAEEEKQYLEKFRLPKNQVERSFFQYLCQNREEQKRTKIIKFLIFTPIIITYLLKPNFPVRFKNEEKVLFLSEGMEYSLMPKSLKEQYANIKIINVKKTNKNFYLSFGDKIAISKFFLNYWKYSEFVLKVLLKTGFYSSVIQTYKPDTIIVHNEYSYTSSFLTGYLQNRKIKHINVMHGEKLYNIRDSFASFDKFYVWDYHYVELLSDLKQPKEQFVVEPPEITNYKIKEDIIYDFTYYLGNESYDVMKRINNSLKLLAAKGHKIVVRFHPRYSDSNEIKELFENFIIEDPSKISIIASLSRTRNVVSLYSTVLFLNYLRSGDNVIDDLNDIEKYNKLQELRFIMLNKPHQLLSKHIENK